MPKTNDASTPGLLGEAVPPAILLLDLSVPPRIVGAMPFGDEVMYVPKSRVTNQPGATMTVYRQDASLGGRLVSSETNSIIGYVDFRDVNFKTGAVQTRWCHQFHVCG